MLPSEDAKLTPSSAALDHRPDPHWSPGMVSIWTGSFPSVEAADAYFDETYHHDDTPISQFARDLGLRSYPSDCLEFHFEDTTVHPLAELLAQCSFSESYAREVLAVAQLRGITAVQGVALLFQFDYGRIKEASTGTCLSFLDVFRFRMETGIPWLDRLTNVTSRHPAAYLTVLDALRTAPKVTESVHLHAEELCDSLLRHMQETYRDLAQQRLFQFGLVSSEAVGEVVAELIAAKILIAQEEDRPEDFRGLFTLDAWFPTAAIIRTRSVSEDECR